MTLAQADATITGHNGAGSSRTVFPDMPPTGTLALADAPPDSDDPTSAQLKGDIDSGRTGDKIGAYDPGLSPLGTDDEAAGTPPTPFRIRLARQLEGVQRWRAGRRHRPPHETDQQVAIAYYLAIVAIGIILVSGISWMR